jgi:YidC/Oxa1 family membrane protein insertase
MQSLQRIAPHLKVLQEKYKDDKQRLQQETMKFYQEHKVNPFASCLPLVAQLPVFLSLFYMLRHDLRLDICPNINPPGTTNPVPCGETPASQFWFIPDITNKATGTTLVILLVLYVGSQLVSSLLMMTATADKNHGSSCWSCRSCSSGSSSASRRACSCTGSPPTSGPSGSSSSCAASSAAASRAATVARGAPASAPAALRRRRRGGGGGLFARLANVGQHRAVVQRAPTARPRIPVRPTRRRPGSPRRRRRPRGSARRTVGAEAVSHG